MKSFIVKYGTFLTLPIVIALLLLILSTLTVSMKTPVTLFAYAQNNGMLYMPKSKSFAISSNDTLILNCAEGTTITCAIANIHNEPESIRMHVKIKNTAALKGNTMISAYIVKNDIPMYQLILNKILKVE